MSNGRRDDVRIQMPDDSESQSISPSSRSDLEARRRNNFSFQGGQQVTINNSISLVNLCSSGGCERLGAGVLAALSERGNGS